MEPTIGIITALTKEYVAVKTLFPEGEPYRASGRGAGNLVVDLLISWISNIGDMLRKRALTGQHVPVAGSAPPIPPPHR